MLCYRQERSGTALWTKPHLGLYYLIDECHENEGWSLFSARKSSTFRHDKKDGMSEIGEVLTVVL